MAPRVSAVLLVFLLVTFPAASAVTPPAVAGTGPAAQQTQQPAPPPENMTFNVQLRPGGDARWTVTTTFALADANDTRAFEQIGAAFEAGRTDRNLATQFRNVTDAAAAATGREMRLTDIGRDYTVDDRQGRLSLSFTWTNFSTVNGTRLVVRDAFYTPNGTWLNSLTEDQSLVVSPPPGYSPTTSPENSYLDDRDLRIDGPETFTRGELTIVYESGDSVGTAGPGGPGDLSGSLPLLGGILLLVALLVAVLLYRIDPDRFPAAGANGTDGGDDAPPATGPANGSGETEPQSEEIDVELLSDEERVERLLEQNGGRMKQARIVTETGWSNAKVSQLLSSMDDEDRIDKLRIGRENLISFPDEDVTEIED